jgi:hypothetical protein
VRARFNSGPGSESRSVYAGDPHETHYTVKEIAKEWRVDEETVRQAFIDEVGVLIIGDQERHDGKRAYLTIRIPESVLHRVYAERTARRFHLPKNRNWKVRGTRLAPETKGAISG